MNDFTGRVKRDEWKPPKGEMRTVTVALDAAQYHIDVRDIAEKGAEDVYSIFNVLMRRKPKENNFKAIPESIRDLMNEYCIVPEWLHNVFLGYGNPSPAQWPNMPNLLETVDFKDTFLDANHLSGRFPDFEVSFINADGAEALDPRPPFRITLPKTLKGNTNALSGNKISEVNPADNVNMVDDSPKEKLIVEAYTPPDPGPYPQASRNRTQLNLHLHSILNKNLDQLAEGSSRNLMKADDRILSETWEKVGPFPNVAKAMLPTTYKSGNLPSYKLPKSEEQNHNVVDQTCYKNSRGNDMPCQAQADVPAPLATKIYYSQRNNRLRSEIGYMFHASDSQELDYNIKVEEVTQLDITQSKISLQRSTPSGQKSCTGLKTITNPQITDSKTLL